MKTRGTFYFLAFLLGMTLIACGIDPGSGVRVETSSGTASVVAFEQTAFPIVRDKCQSCHGFSQAPLFAVADVTRAFGTAIDYVNFSHAENSRLVQYGGNSHCGINCSSGTGEALTAAISEWARLSNELGGSQLGNAVVTGEKEVPALGGNLATIEWDLGEIDSLYDGARFALSVEEFAPGVYRFSNPRLRTGASAVSVHDIRILVNGYWDPANVGYRDIERHVVAQAGYNTLSSDSMLVFAGSRPSSDLIQVAFGDLGTGCNNFSEYEQNVAPIFAASCKGCHDSSERNHNVAAALAWDMDGSDETVCYRALRRTSPGNLLGSAIIQFPLLGSPMYTTPRIDEVEADTILEWLEGEYPSE